MRDFNAEARRLKIRRRLFYLWAYSGIGAMLISVYSPPFSLVQTIAGFYTLATTGGVIAVLIRQRL